MKKENQSEKKDRNMSIKSTPKRIQHILTVVNDFFVGIVNNNSSKEDILKAIEDSHDDLVKILKQNIPNKKDSSVKKIKDPDAPKRGKSSYIYFCVEKREDIKKNNPDMSAKEIIKELGRIWRENVSVKDKARYEKLSSDDKVRYESERKDYIPSNDVVQKNSKRSGPKRGLTGYIYFCNEFRSVVKEENNNLTTKEITSELGKRWRDLSEKDRKPYEKLAEKDKDRYEKEKELLVDPDNNDVISSDKESKSKKKDKVVKSNKKVKSSKDDKEVVNNRKKSGYILYCQELRQIVKDSNNEWTSQQITKELGRKWKELSDTEKASYNVRASEVSEVKSKPSSTKKSKSKSKSKSKKSKSKKSKSKKSKSKKSKKKDDSNLDNIEDYNSD